jgi:hypothetical protein
MLEKLARPSSSVEAPTVIAEAALQGDIVQLSPPLLFPAGKTCHAVSHMSRPVLEFH